jgi:uncharacterized protein YyaL (SSP411 family)
MTVYDPADGGFGQGENKFPTPVNVDFLMAAAWDVEPVRRAVLHTLDRMAMGGMYDQVGGGFHRYSTDRQWLVPHFEKMLYDNGQLATTYAVAFERTSDPYYAQVVRETLDYVLREMVGGHGAFYSAQDAEVNHLEGGNYIWTADEVRAALDAAGQGDDVDFALDVYGFDRGPNFQDPHHPEAGRKNVVFLVERPDAKAKALGMTDDEFEARVQRVNAAMLAVRDTRDQPLTDDKILAGWNGLMIAGMADGGRVLGEARYVEAAAAAATFVLEKMRDDSGGLLRTHRGATTKIEAFLEDYAYVIRGLVALHRATGETRWADEAVALVAAARDRFADEARGGFFDTQSDQSDLFVRVKTTYDGATPSGNAVMINDLLDLHAITGDAAHLDGAVAALASVSGRLAEYPTTSVVSMEALDRIAREHPERLEAGAGETRVQRGPIGVSVSTKDIALADGGSATVDLTINVGAGFHVNSSEPGVEGLIPLEVAIVGGEGVEIDVDYPAGTAWAGPLGEMNVHEGTVVVGVTIRRTGAITGRPRLTVTWQACNDRACLAPVTEELPVHIGAE